jgi:hypothetical protein
MVTTGHVEPIAADGPPDGTAAFPCDRARSRDRHVHAGDQALGPIPTGRSSLHRVVEIDDDKRCGVP